MRKLRWHEQKLLKHVDFHNWKSDTAVREAKILRRYAVEDRADYWAYVKLAGSVKQLAQKLAALEAEDPLRKRAAEILIAKLYWAGLVPEGATLASCARLTASAFARRRLAVVLVSTGFASDLRQATAFVRHGHVALDGTVVRNPARHIARAAADGIAWADGSKPKRHVAAYHQEDDDFELDEM